MATNGGCQSQGATPEAGQDSSTLGTLTDASEPNSDTSTPQAANANTPEAMPVTTVADGNAVQIPAGPTSPNNATPQINASPNLRFVGRFDLSSPNAPIMAWPGSKVVAGFTGTSLTLNLRAVDQQVYYGIGNVDNYLNVSIDGATSRVVRISQDVASFVLAQGLQPGQHTVEITKRTESQIGSLQFVGFTLDAGASLAPGPLPQSRRIEVIGDSGSVGYGAEGNWALSQCSFTPATENAAVAYSMVAANLLNAEVHVTGGSGKGIYQNRDTVDDTYYTLPVMWGLTSADTLAQPSNKANLLWNANSWTPDAVVIVVGGNDFAASIPPAAAYNTTAVKFLQALRSAYPNAWLYVATSPMLDPPVQGSSKPSTSEVATQYAKAAVSSMADAKVAYLGLALDDGSRGYGCDYHMNAATHQLTGQAIAKAIAADLNWK